MVWERDFATACRKVLWKSIFEGVKKTMKVSEVFNDFYSLLTGKKFWGLNRLMEKYREEPLFWVMLSNLSETEELSLLDAMQEAYGLYKEFAEEKAGAGVRMEQLYDRAIKYGQKWDNLWCWQLAGALVAILDPGTVRTEEQGKAA